MPPLRMLITAGPTREPLDPVRFLSNRSSGRMGYALAEAARAAGHRVTLISGPVVLEVPRGVRRLSVETAEEMRRVVLREAKRADLVVMAAAVADYRPVRVAPRKMKKGAAQQVLRLERTPDILAELGRRRRPSQILAGFAAETDHLLLHARAKLRAKNLDFIVANRVGRSDAGFESPNNRATLLDRAGGTRRFPLMTKKQLARRLLAAILSATD